MTEIGQNDDFSNIVPYECNFAADAHNSCLQLRTLVVDGDDEADTELLWASRACEHDLVCVPQSLRLFPVCTM